MKSLRIFDKLQETKFDFVKHAWKFAIASLVIFLAGIIVWIACGLNLGLDFTGGSIVKVQIGSQLDENGAYNTYADKIEEMKTICWFCPHKATMNLRIHNGKPVYEGEQVQIGGNESYYPVCRKHYFHPQLKQ